MTRGRHEDIIDVTRFKSLFNVALKRRKVPERAERLQILIHTAFKFHVETVEIDDESVLVEKFTSIFSSPGIKFNARKVFRLKQRSGEWKEAEPFVFLFIVPLNCWWRQVHVSTLVLGFHQKFQPSSSLSTLFRLHGGEFSVKFHFYGAVKV